MRHTGRLCVVVIPIVIVIVSDCHWLRRLSLLKFLKYCLLILQLFCILIHGLAVIEARTNCVQGNLLSWPQGHLLRRSFWCVYFSVNTRNLIGCGSSSPTWPQGRPHPVVLKACATAVLRAVILFLIWRANCRHLNIFVNLCKIFKIKSIYE